MPLALHTSQLHSLPLLSRGKVRDNYALGNDRILMVASDRISAFDVVMDQPIPGKGALLTKMALFWFEKLGPNGLNICPNHLTHEDPSQFVTEAEKQQIIHRSMVVKRLKPLPIEAVVRGYLAGSGWAEYQATQTICSLALPPNLKNASRLEEPIFTPAAKAAMGEHDENITFQQVIDSVGISVAQRVKEYSLKLYSAARDIAAQAGIIIADTKFEFGLDENGSIVLMDEILTPDSSRYWPTEHYREGVNPPSYDKQFLRDWLETVQINSAPWPKSYPPPELPTEIIEKTAAKYNDAWLRLSSRS
jgi:phosphoribosylaminoimidazole-succinocarboxamide synthase